MIEQVSVSNVAVALCRRTKHRLDFFCLLNSFEGGMVKALIFDLTVRQLLQQHIERYRQAVLEF